MHVTDKLTRPLTEAKYLNADNVDRYRSIIRIFYENYEKLRYWLYQEEVYEEMREILILRITGWSSASRTLPC